METKVTRNEALSMLAEEAIAAARYTQQALENEMRKLNVMSMDERNELARLGHAVVERWNPAPFGDRSGAASDGATVTVHVPENRLPDWYTRRRARVAFLERRIRAVSQTIEQLRDRGTQRVAVLTQLFDSTPEGKELLGRIKRLALTMKVAVAPVPGGSDQAASTMVLQDPSKEGG